MTFTAISPPKTALAGCDSDQQTMLNFRVTDLDAMLAQLRAAGPPVGDEIAEA